MGAAVQSACAKPAEIVQSVGEDHRESRGAPQWCCVFRALVLRRARSRLRRFLLEPSSTTTGDVDRLPLSPQFENAGLVPRANAHVETTFWRTLQLSGQSGLVSQNGALRD